jgi:hypothetical protein
MSKRIFGDAETIKRAREAGTANNYINWDAINELPEEYEAVITEIKFDPKKLDADFSPVDGKNGDTWMPQPQMMYRIAEACGISGGPDSQVEPLIEEVDINLMLMKPMDAEPTIRKMIVGRQVTKYSERLQEDGTFLKSSPCTVAYNAYERCCGLWANEEKSTNGYDSSIVKQWASGDKYVHVEYKKNGKTESFDAALKYDTPYKRKAHFYEELKFAHAKAETKAHEKTIRELAGLQTGYKTDMLASGSLTFAKIRRSREILKMESAARLGAMSRGEVAPVRQLFAPDVAAVDDAPPTAEQPEIDPFAVTDIPGVHDAEPEQKKTPRECLITTLEHYKAEKLVPDNMIGACDKILAWLNKEKNAEKDNKVWPLAIERLKTIENAIPEKKRITHELYK